jgi:hypothetical protein
MHAALQALLQSKDQGAQIVAGILGQLARRQNLVHDVGRAGRGAKSGDTEQPCGTQQAF